MALAPWIALLLATPPVVEGDACDFDTLLAPMLARRGVTAPVHVRIDDATIEIELPGRVRRVPRSPSCAADLDLVVLIVERQAKDLVLEPDEDPLPELEPRALHFEIGASGGVELGERIAGALELAVRGELSRFLELQLGARLLPPVSIEVTRDGRALGTLNAWSIAPWIGAGVGLDAGRQRIFASASLGLERVTGGSTDLFQSIDVARWTPHAGLEARYDIALWPETMWLSLSVGSRFRFDAPTFAVEGASEELDVPAASLVGRAGLWARFF